MCHISVKTAAESAHGRFKMRVKLWLKLGKLHYQEKTKAVSIKSDKYEGVHSCSFLKASWCAKYHTLFHWKVLRACHVEGSFSRTRNS